MTRYATITRLHGPASFGSSGGVDIKGDDGKAAFLAGSSYVPTKGSARVAVGERVEILDNGRHWTVIDESPAEVFHPDSHPEPPPAFRVGHVDAGPIKRVPRGAQLQQPPDVQVSELQVLGGILAALNRNNELQEKILAELKNQGVKAL